MFTITDWRFIFFLYVYFTNNEEDVCKIIFWKFYSFKLVQWLSTNYTKELYKLGKYLYKCSKLRKETENYFCFENILSIILLIITFIISILSAILYIIYLHIFYVLNLWISVKAMHLIPQFLVINNTIQNRIQPGNSTFEVISSITNVLMWLG